MNVTLSLTVDEVNYILGALGQRPFAEVQQLIFKIKQDAESQLIPAPAPAAEPEAAAVPDSPDTPAS
jgi:hypothetical protein